MASLARLSLIPPAAMFGTLFRQSAFVALQLLHFNKVVSSKKTDNRGEVWDAEASILGFWDGPVQDCAMSMCLIWARILGIAWAFTLF